jgi:hypothetical protein
VEEQGFDIDTEAVLEAVGSLRLVRGDFDEVANYTAEADPDWWMWGAPGAVFAQQYEASALQIRVILFKLGPAMDGICSQIEASCAAYDEADGSASVDICDAGGDPGSTYV